MWPTIHRSRSPSQRPHYRAGGEDEDRATMRWYDEFAEAIGDARVVIGFEPADGLAVAAACTLPVGIDLVTIDDCAPGRFGDALSEREIDAWAHIGERHAIEVPRGMLAFAAKEAVIKLGRSVGATWRSEVLPAGPRGPRTGPYRVAIVRNGEDPAPRSVMLTAAIVQARLLAVAVAGPAAA